VFATVPSNDGKHYLTSYLFPKEERPELEPGESVAYELHLDCGEGSRNDALRETYRVRGGYRVDPSKYDYSKYEKLPWVKDIVAASINWAWDMDNIDPRTGEYHLAESLKKAQKLHGGYDIYMFWPFWPRAGWDERLQFDHYRDFPGGLPGLKDEIRKIHDLAKWVGRVVTIADGCVAGQSLRGTP
jgi:hypothetical protein